MQLQNTNLLIELEAKINMLTEKYDDSENTAHAVPTKPKQIYLPANTSEFTVYVIRNTSGALGMHMNQHKQITMVEQDGPAAKAQIKLNDIIVRVNNQDLKGLDEFKTASLIKGEAGTLVHLTLLREVRTGEVFM